MTDSLMIVSALLNADTAVKAIVTNRNYPLELPERAAPPCNLLMLVGGRDDQLLSGAARYYEGRIRIESIAVDQTAAMNLGTAVRTALESIVKQTVAGATDVDVWFDNFDTADRADDRSTFRRIQDFGVRYKP